MLKMKGREMQAKTKGLKTNIEKKIEEDWKITLDILNLKRRWVGKNITI